MSEQITIRRALISCWDKKGVVNLASVLRGQGVDIISSGGTFKVLTDAGIPAMKVEDITGFPEILDGRVKTLHPLIHGAILARRTTQHLQQLNQHKIVPVDLVVVNLYPFLSVLQEGEKDLQEMIEFIDIGGPAMLRAAAKNSENVVAVHRPEQYERFVKEFQANGGSISRELSRKFAAEAFFYTAYYDSQVSAYLTSIDDQSEFPLRMSMFFSGKKDLRYGENPHQKAAIFSAFGGQPPENSMIQLHGKEMSFNNYVDVAAAYSLAAEFKKPAVAVIKHTNPCGAAIADTIQQAFKRAHAGDPLSAFGGIIASNGEIDRDTAGEIRKTFFECVIAPSFSAGALEILKKKKNLRILQFNRPPNGVTKKDYKFLNIGLLAQDADHISYQPEKLKSAGEREPTSQEMEDLLFAWTIVKHVKSNAIVLARGKQILGVGAGQMSRVDAVQLACKKATDAGHQTKGTVLASDAFFPFRDGVDEAAKAGITAIIQPGGSIRDAEVIDAAREQGVAMILTGIRHFKH